VITGSYGLGESVVGGRVDPDEVQVSYFVHPRMCLIQIHITPPQCFCPHRNPGIQANDWKS
jgi:hypothetical protein